MKEGTVQAKDMNWNGPVCKTDKSKTYTFGFGGKKKLKLDRPSPKKWSIRDKTILSFVHTDNH